MFTAALLVKTKQKNKTKKKTNNNNNQMSNSEYRIQKWKGMNNMHKMRESQKHQFSSVAQSCLTLCDPMDYTRPPCPLPTTRFYSNPCPLSRWCHPTISSSVVPFSSHLQSFPAWGSFQMSQFFASGGQSIGASRSISPSNEYLGLISFRIDWLDLLALQGALKSLLQHHSSEASIPWRSAFFIVQLSHPYMTTEKPWFWLDGPLSAK